MDPREEEQKHPNDNIFDNDDYEEDDDDLLDDEDGPVLDKEEDF